LNAFFLLVFLISNSIQSPEYAIEGVSLNDKENMHIEIYREDGMYFRKVVWMSEPKDKYGKWVLDKNNPEPENRKQRIFGMVLLGHFKPLGNNEYEGRMYSPSKGWYFDGEIEVLSKKQLKLTADLGFIKGSRIWNRIK